MMIGYLKKIGVTLDDRIIIAEDFGSWRKEIDPLYKAQRKEYRESKEEANWWKEEYGKFNYFLPELNDCLPWNFIKIYKMEADDIASMAVRMIQADEKILISSDEDWQMLCSLPNIKIFSPYTKKYKIVTNPEAILLKKIKGDKSDNLLSEPKTEIEWEKRRMIVDLLHLPIHIENIIREEIENLPMKNINIDKIPSRICREGIKKLYKLED
jgi:5'-3' exonuclease